MNKNLFHLQKGISSNPLKNYSLNEFSIVNRNISATPDMEVGVRISLLAGENIIIKCRYRVQVQYFYSADGGVDSWQQLRSLCS